jgi:oligoendopeptidase F
MTNASGGTRQAAGEAPNLGLMPVWNLGDLYPDPQSAEFARDLDKAAEEAKRIAERYKGKLAALGRDGAALAEAIKAYEALSDLMGRLGAYAGLLYAADTIDPVKAKFYGDVQEKLTAISTELVFFEQRI